MAELVPIRPGAQILPIVTAIFEMPQLLDPSGPSNSRVNRVHNKAVKDALRKTLELHHRTRVPLHFRRDARHRYRYYQRAAVTKRQKRRRHGSIIDLVKTGATRDKMTAGYDSIRVGGSAAGGKVVGTLRMRFPFPVGGGRAAGVTPEKMAEEIARFTDQETRQAAEQFLSFYVDEINKNIRSERVRRRIAPQLGALGIG